MGWKKFIKWFAISMLMVVTLGGHLVYGEEVISDSGEIIKILNDENGIDSGPYIPNTINSYTIIGNDDRYQVGNTAKFPFSPVVRIACTNGSTDYYGTGVLISPDTVVTAAHVVYSGKKWNKDIAIQPGYNNGVMPFGSTNKIKNIYVYKKWFDSESVGYDLAVIKLNERIGDRTGFLGLPGTPQQGSSIHLNLTGYPGETGKRGKMYTSSGYATVDTDIKYRHSIDTTPGNSGSPMYSNDGYLHGVHTHGGNYGTRLNSEYLSFVRNIRNNSPAYPSKFKANDIVRLGGEAKRTSPYSSNEAIPSNVLAQYYRVEQVAPLSKKWDKSEYQVLISSYSNSFRKWVYEQDLGLTPAAKFKMNSSVHLSRSATVASRYWSRGKLESKYLADNYTIVDIASTAESTSPYQYRLRHRTLGDLWVLEQDLHGASKFNKNEAVKLQSFAINAGSWSSNKKIEAHYLSRNFTIVDIARVPQSNSNYQCRIRDSANGVEDLWVLEQDLKK